MDCQYWAMAMNCVWGIVALFACFMGWVFCLIWNPVIG